MPKIKFTLITALFLGAITGSLFAVAHDGPHDTASATESNLPLVDGEVKKIDASAGKITLKHGAIVNLDMPAMTMVFVLKDQTQIAALKVGDKVKFSVNNEDGKMVIAHIQVQPVK